MRTKQSDFLKWRKAYFIEVDAAAEYFQVTAKTIRNWDKNGAPHMAMRLIAIQTGDLSGIHPAWRGWKISHTGKLHGPSRFTTDPEHLSAVPAIVERLNQLEGSIEAQAREQNSALLRLQRQTIQNFAHEFSNLMKAG